MVRPTKQYRAARLSTLLAAAQKHQARFVFSKVHFMNENGQPLPADVPHSYYHFRSDAELFPTRTFELIRHNTALTTGNFFFHCSLYEEVGEFSPIVVHHHAGFHARHGAGEEVVPAYPRDVRRPNRGGWVNDGDFGG